MRDTQTRIDPDTCLEAAQHAIDEAIRHLRTAKTTSEPARKERMNKTMNELSRINGDLEALFIAIIV